MRLVVPVLLLLVGCATPYQPAYNGHNGYSELQLNQRAFQVFFNGKVEKDVAHRYALRRAAELTIKHNFAGFVVNDDQTRTEASIQHGLTTCNTIGGVTRCGGGSSISFTPTAQLTIRMLDPEEVRSAPSHLAVYDPKLLLSQIQPAAGAPPPSPGSSNAKRVYCGEPGAPC